MEILTKFIKSAHSDKSTFTRYDESIFLLKIKSDKTKSEPKFLEEFQQDFKTESPLYLNDILNSIEDVEKNIKNDSDIIHKIVVQKSNTDVTPESAISGYWTTLAFLYRSPIEHRLSGTNYSWLLYALGRGRYKPKFLELEKGDSTSLGYSHFISINQKLEKQDVKIS